AVLRRAVARGELRRGVDLELVLDLLNAPLFYRFLLTGQPVDERLVRQVVKAVVRAFTPE
ncbi:MAG TPA: TetR-like C-terminal domain-containing protein, partial [Gemmatimonadaceae bacterium]|nr:TetR-like C-terminal domain-containing protein [Gemmatimonadaceae bacterium]